MFSSMDEAEQIERSPAFVLREHMTDPEFARVARDDAANLAALEERLGGFASAEPMRGPKPTILSVAEGLLTSFTTGFGQAKQGLRMAGADLLGLDTVPARAMRERALLDTEAALSTPEFETRTASGVYGGVSSFLRQLPGLAASVALRSPVPSLAEIGTTTSAEAYSRYRERGATPEQAALGAVGEGAVEVGTELLPMGFLVDRLGKAGFKEFIAGFLVRELPGEQIATLAQDALDTAIANPDKTWGDYWSERPDQAYETLIATATQTGIVGSANTVATHMDRKRRQADAALQHAEAIAQINAIAANSQLRTRDPELFQQYVSSLAGDDQSVYIDADVLLQVAQDDPETAAALDAMPSIAEQLAQEAPANGAIRIPVTEYVSAVSGTGAAETLTPNLRATPEAPTAVEAEVFFQQEAEETRAEAERVLAEQAGNDAFVTSAQEVEDRIVADLNASGRFTGDVNATYAALARDLFVTQAARLGVTPTELYDRYPLRVTAERVAGAGLDQLDYFKEPNFYERRTEDGVQRVAKPNVSDEDILYAVDPTDSDIAELNAEAEALDPAIGAELRVLKDNSTNKVYMWPAVAATHADFMTANGIDPTDADHGVASNGEVNWTYSPSSESGQPAVESEPLSRFVLPEAYAQSQRVTDTPEFKAWFGDSKVVDENGEPLVVYHATNAKFTEFDTPSYFTEDRKDATGYGKNIESYYLAIENPYVASDEQDAENRSELTEVDEAYASQLAAEGYDGVLGYRNGNVAWYIPFRPEQIKSATGNRGTFDPNDPSIVNQGERGFFNPSTNTIALLRNADLSTFTHELGHFYLEMLSDLAAQPDAPAEIVSDMQTLLGWFGIDSLDAWRAMDLEAKRVHHEKLARGFEAYIFEGKSPSLELHGVFQRLSAWMKRVYKSLTELNVELSDEVRGVFDRMLATDTAITEMEQARQLRPLFEQREDFPGDDAAWAEYQAEAREAHDAGVEQLQSRSLRDMQWAARFRLRALKQYQKAAEAKRKAMRAEVEQDLARERVYAAQTFLRTGEVVDGALPALTSAQKRILTESGLVSTKLDLDALKALYGDGPAAPWRYLPTGKNGLAGQNGIDPALAAQLWGYESADTLVRDILATEPFDAAVDAETDSRMLQRYGDLANPQAIEQAVNEAVHNEVRTRFVANELRAVEKAAGITQDSTRALKALVKDSMRGRRVKDIRPAKFEAAESRAAREAQAARKKGDISAAVQSLRQRFWHHLSAKEARRVEQEIERGVKYLRKFNKRNDSLTLEHQERIDDLLARFDLRASTTQRDLSRRESLTEWLNSVEEETGVRPVVDPALEREAYSTHYRNMTVEEFRGLVDAVKSIEHIGRRTQKLLASRDKRVLAETAQAFKANADENAPRMATQRAENVRLRDRARTMVDRLFAGHLKLATIMRELDGYKDNGFANETFVLPANRAGADEGVRMAKSSDALHALFKPVMARVNPLRMNTPEVVEGAIDRNGRPVALSYQARLVVALNAGNEVNWQRMRDGHGWSDSTIQAVLDSLTKEDLDFVQGVWDHLETYKDELRDLQREIVGVEPEWVEAQPVTAKNGSLRGGYFPIRYDSRLDPQSKAFEDFEDLAAMMRGARRAQKTPSGFLERRAKGDIAIPVRLDFGVLFSHITAVNHRLAWERWVYDTKRLMRQADVKSAIVQHMGAEAFNTVNDLVTEVALGRTPTTNHPLERLIEGLSNNASIAVMGWQLVTVSMQPLGFTQSITRLGGARGGYRWFANGMRQFYVGDWLENLRGIHEKSAFMKERALNMNQNIRHIRQRLEKPGAVVAVRDTFFAPMVAFQTALDAPTWLGAYNKALAPTSENGLALDEAGAIDYADQVVRDAQGSGILSDLAAAQRHGGAWALFTRFYNYMNTTLQLNVDIFRREKTTAGDYAVAAHDFVMTNIIPAILVTTLRHVLSGDDGEEPFVEEVARELGSFFFGMFVGLRELSGLPQGFDYRGPAGLRVLPSAYRAAGKAIEGDFDRQFWKELTNVIGFALGLPSIQINRTIDGTMALINGDTDRPTAVLFGPPR